MKLFSSLSQDPLARRRQLVAGTVILALLFIAVLYLVFKPASSTEPTPTPTPTSEPTASPSESASPSVSPSPTATTASPSPSPSASAVSMPAELKTTLANFYKAYSEKNSAKLETYFTADTDPDIKEMRSILFTGKDPQGTYLGGPVLFASNNVSQYTTSYTVQSATQDKTKWVVKVQEKRLDPEKHEFTTITEITLVPGTTVQFTWMIDNYVHIGSSGKYNGFFTE